MEERFFFFFNVYRSTYNRGSLLTFKMVRVYSVANLNVLVWM